MSDIKRIFIEGTIKTPQIDFDPLSGDLILSGRSFPENAAKVYEPLQEWIIEYIKSPQSNTNIHLKLEYFNSSSLIWIVKMIKFLSKIDKEGSSLFINLYFDNEDFDHKDKDEFKDVICSVFDNIEEPKVKIGIKIKGTDSKGNVVDESLIFI